MNTNSNNTHRDYNNFKRDRYFHGMLMTDRDFTEEQKYHNDKRRLHNRNLHGWGVVCGLGIEAKTPNSSVIKITPGMALDCHGNEIIVCSDFEIDIKQTDISKGTSALCATPENDCRYYVVIKYIEESSDRVPVYAPGGGCEEKVCEYSRTREGFCIDLFKDVPCNAVLPDKGLFTEILECVPTPQSTQRSGSLPVKVPTTINIEGIQDCIKGKLKDYCKKINPCPECSCTKECNGIPYVVLGSINFKGCSITSINQDMISINDNRRYVITPIFWEYYLASLNPSIAPAFVNPFILYCYIYSNLFPSAKTSGPQMQKGQFPFGNINLNNLIEITEVRNKTDVEARKILGMKKIGINQTIPLSARLVPDLLMRFASMEKIESGMKVDLVTDDESKKVLFYVPAAEAPEKEDIKELTDRIQKNEEMIESLKETIAELSQKIEKSEKKSR